MGSRLVFAHLLFPLWCWPSSIDKHNSVGGEMTVGGWECLKHHWCLHCTPLPYPKEDQALRTELFLVPTTMPRKRYWGYICEALVPNEVWTGLHQHWLDMVSAGFASTGDIICPCALCLPLVIYRVFCAMKPLLSWPAAQALREEIRSLTFWNWAHGLTPIF